MNRYAVPRHIWRSLYPLLIFWGLILPSWWFIDCIPGEFLLAELGLTAIFTLIWRRDKLRLPRYGGVKHLPSVIVLAVLANIGINLTLMAALDSFFTPTFFEYYRQEAQEITAYTVTLDILRLGVTTPVAEELLFRGILLNRLRQWMPPKAAIAAGSILFGAMHLTVANGSAAVFLGAADCLLYLRYRNLWVPIAGHMAYNLTSIWMTLLSKTPASDRLAPWHLLIPGVLTAAVCVWFLVTHTEAAVKIEQKEGRSPDEDIDT